MLFSPSSSSPSTSFSFPSSSSSSSSCSSFTQTILSGMGELHLEVILDRVRRDYRVEADIGKLQVSYREAPCLSATQSGTTIKLCVPSVIFLLPPFPPFFTSLPLSLPSLPPSFPSFSLSLPFSPSLPFPLLSSSLLSDSLERRLGSQSHSVSVSLTVEPSPTTGRMPEVDVPPTATLSLPPSMTRDEVMSAIHSGIEMACLRGEGVLMFVIW